MADLIAENSENFDHLFTPERPAKINRADAEVQAGHLFTIERVDAHLAEMKAEWRRNNPL